MMLEMLSPDVMERLRLHNIREDEYKLKLGKKHGEGREGIPYRMLIIRKKMPAAEQKDLEWELRSADETLCVIFKRYIR